MLGHTLKNNITKKIPISVSIIPLFPKKKKKSIIPVKHIDQFNLTKFIFIFIYLFIYFEG